LLPFRAGVPAIGVGHEPKPVPDVRGADARSRQYRRPDGVAFSLQVSLNKIEPAVGNRRFNLLTKNNWRAALADEPEPDGPEVPGIVESCTVAGNGKGLAGA
jgi:hypothetical protein